MHHQLMSNDPKLITIVPCHCEMAGTNNMKVFVRKFYLNICKKKLYCIIELWYQVLVIIYLWQFLWYLDFDIWISHVYLNMMESKKT